MAINIPSLQQIIIPKKKGNPKGTSFTNTFQPSNTSSVLAPPGFRNHLTDVFETRVTQDSRALIKDLVKYDSDMSATLHAFLTTANTQPRFYVYDMEGALDRDGQKTLDQLLTGMTVRRDYSTGYAISKSLRELSEDLRYMVLLRGGCGGELVFDKFLVPAEIRHVDMATIEWFEKSPGIYKPQQRPPGASGVINLDIANFFTKSYRQNPTEIYSESIFVSSINTIAARQQVINDLYRIMQKQGYPRIEISVMEEILRKNAPMEMQQNEEKMRQWLNARLSDIASDVSTMRPDAAYVHFDAIEAKMLNEKGPGTSMNVESVIGVLDSQNQAALKTMSTIIGKGEGGVNTASVEARIFSMAAESLNGPIADLFSDMMTLAMRVQGYEGYVTCKFDPVELRPSTELEPQLVLKSGRLRQDLSDGLITDDEYHIMMYNRIRPDSAPELSGTGFMTPVKTGAEGASPNTDPLGRSVTAPGSASARSKQGGTGK
jgi:hypothetical protein